MTQLPTKTKALVVQNAPVAECDLTLGNSSSTFKLVELDCLEWKKDRFCYGAKVQLIYLSNDPAQRGWIQKDADEARAYVKPVREGDVMNSGAAGRVLDSKSDKFQVGDLVLGSMGWMEYTVVNDTTVRKLTAIPGLSPSVFLGAFGGAGLTAYFGLTDILKLQKGQSLVVSGAAGAVGNIVVQYAKHVIGASKVVAIAGSDAKCEWLKRLGADITLNYKSDDFKKQLNDATEGFVDAYFDNVGGEILDQMLLRVRRKGRVAACGAISGYNSADPTRLSNYFEIIANHLTLAGFIVLDYVQQFPEGIQELTNAYKQGKIDISDSETLIEASFEEVPSVWGKLFVGANTGKLITQITKL